MARGLSSCGSQALERRLSSCGSRVQLLRGMWDLPGPGIEPVSSALAGGFLTTAPPGKSYMVFLMRNYFYDLIGLQGNPVRLGIEVNNPTFYKFYLFLAVLGLRCSARASHCGGFCCCGARALDAQASVVAARGLSSCGSWALEHRLGSCGSWT